MERSFPDMVAYDIAKIQASRPKQSNDVNRGGGTDFASKGIQSGQPVKGKRHEGLFAINGVRRERLCSINEGPCSIDGDRLEERNLCTRWLACEPQCPFEKCH
jgi:hypothetical protein